MLFVCDNLQSSIGFIREVPVHNKGQLLTYMQIKLLHCTTCILHVTLYVAHKSFVAISKLMVESLWFFSTVS